LTSHRKKYLIRAAPEKVWSALVDPALIERWKRLVQEWYGGDWSEPSVVTFFLLGKNGSTKPSPGFALREPPAASPKYLKRFLDGEVVPLLHAASPCQSAATTCVFTFVFASREG